MSTTYPTSTCKGCGKPIVWGLTILQKRIPLDPAAPVYDVQPADQAQGAPFVARDSTRMVSHFATCPKANDFSGRARKAKA